MKGSADLIFKELYDAHADDVFRYALSMTRDKNRAMDCTQETFMKFLSYLRKGKEVEHPKAFLFRSAKNWVIDQSRKHSSSSLDELSEGGFDPESHHSGDNVQKHAEDKDILARLQKEHPDAYELVMLRHAYNMPVSELAEMYDVTENTMSVRIHRAIQTLKESSEDSQSTQ